ncbi:MAG: hypothetical protein HY937_00965 [Nitrosomonadales bacterium]|nr:hypothetical protein [Nitrosomonadales bacterium]
MHTMHQPHGTEKDIQGVRQVVVQRLDGAVAGIFAAEQAHYVIKGGFGKEKIVCRVNAPDNICRLGPYLVRIAVGEKVMDFGGCWGVFHWWTT